MSYFLTNNNFDLTYKLISKEAVDSSALFSHAFSPGPLAVRVYLRTSAHANITLYQTSFVDMLANTPSLYPSNFTVAAPVTVPIGGYLYVQIYGPDGDDEMPIFLQEWRTAAFTQKMTVPVGTHTINFTGYDSPQTGQRILQYGGGTTYLSESFLVPVIEHSVAFSALADFAVAHERGEESQYWPVALAKSPNRSASVNFSASSSMIVTMQPRETEDFWPIKLASINRVRSVNFSAAASFSPQYQINHYNWYDFAISVISSGVNEQIGLTQNIQGSSYTRIKYGTVSESILLPVEIEGITVSPTKFGSSLAPISYLQDRSFLKALDELNTKELFVKIIVLNQAEDVVEEIQGKVSDGQLNISGDSALRRTGNLTFIPDEKEGNLTDVKNIISINKKVRVEVGYTNELKEEHPYYKDYDIIWFPLGIYILTDASMSQSTSGKSISIQIQDKMCLLNGTSGGVIPAAATLSTVKYINEAEQEVEESVRIYTIIKELVNHFGGEALDKIIISDIEPKTKQLLKWSPAVGAPNQTLYKYPEGDYLYTISETAINGKPNGEQISAGQSCGYKYTDFIYPGELTADVGNTVYDVLEKIKGVLGNNYEFFYDIEGNFIFQEIKNYLNTSLSTLAINDMQSQNYMKDIGVRNKSVYDFKDGNLISSFTNSPSYANVKNDFVIWGKTVSADGASSFIRYHLALDQKPLPTEHSLVFPFNLEDWRHVFYRQGTAASPHGTDSNSYFKELQFEWNKLYDTETFAWKPEAIADPSSLKYYLDFIDTGYGLNELSISNIGRRSKVVQDENVNCLFAPTIADLIIIEEGSLNEVDDIEQAINQGMDYAVVSPTLFQSFEQAVGYKDAFSVARDLLYQHASYNTAITLQTIPIYYLDVNTRISVYDRDSGTNGDFMIQSISVPLSPSETMSISATAVLERI